MDTCVDEEEVISDVSDFPVDIAISYLSVSDSDLSEVEPSQNSFTSLTDLHLSRESEQSFAPTPSPCFFDLQDYDDAIHDSEEHYGENNNEQIIELENLRREKKQLLLSNNNLKCRAARLKIYADQLENEVEQATERLNGHKTSLYDVKNTLNEVNQQNNIRLEQIEALRLAKDSLENNLAKVRVDQEETAKLLTSHKNVSEQQARKMRELKALMNKKKKQLIKFKEKHNTQKKLLTFQTKKIMESRKKMSSLVNYVKQLEREKENQLKLLHWHNRKEDHISPRIRRSGSLRDELDKFEEWNIEESIQDENETQEGQETGIMSEMYHSMKIHPLVCTETQNDFFNPPPTPQQQPTPSPMSQLPSSPKVTTTTTTTTTITTTVAATTTTSETEAATMTTAPPPTDIEQKLCKSLFKWSTLKIGDRVCVARENRGNVLGILRYLGSFKSYPGEWLGIELDGPYGKIDGSYQGTRYFTCKPSHGIICRPSCLLPLICKARIGDRVCVRSRKGTVNGILRSMSPFKNSNSKHWAGVELDKPLGNNDGAHEGIRHFTTKPKHGIFVQAYDLFPAAIEIKVGTQVCVATQHGNSNGTVRWTGQFKSELEGEWVGVELEKPNGWTDGTFDHKRYFDAQPNFGIFCRPANLMPPFSKIQSNDRVLVDTRLGHWPGTVRYVGCLSDQCGQWFGVELDGPYGNNDGSFRGTSYFMTKPNHGVFIRPHRVQLLQNARTYLSSAQQEEVTYQKSSGGLGVAVQVNSDIEKYWLYDFSALKNPTTWAKEALKNPTTWAKEALKNPTTWLKTRSERMLCWQAEPIHSPLIRPKSTWNKSLKKLVLKEIIQSFVTIQKFMGQTKKKPTQLNVDIYDLLQCATRLPEICDSLYLLMIKQIRKNPAAEAVKRAWQLMALCLTVFRPSEEFGPYLERFIRLNTVTAKKYFCWELLEQRNRLGTIGHDQVPRLEKGFDVEEVLQERTPDVFTVEPSLNLRRFSV